MQLNPIVDSRDVHFILFEMLGIDSLQKTDVYKDFDKETLQEVLDLAEVIAVEKVYPANSPADKTGVQFDPTTKNVVIPQELFEGLDAYYEAGFIGVSQDVEIGGMGMPFAVGQSVMDYFTSASVSFSLYPALSHGVIDLIKHYYSGKDKELILDRLLSGEWGGTMCLTEPDAGSDVGALRTKAVLKEDNDYRINGTKIFISSGDGNYYKNIIHTVLARIEGDPPGTKGISIFMTPKYTYKSEGSIQDANDVVTSGIEHKMGIHASSTCTLNFGDNNNCVGTLIGEQRKGMRIMFHMMNEARLFVGLQGLSVSSAAYMHTVTYARNRLQGVDISDMLKPDAVKITISKHPDIKRILLSMKSRVEAMRSLIYFNGYLMDLVRAGKGDEAKEAQALIDFLIPITKAGNTDLAWRVTEDAIQVYGGYGYTQDYPVEQYARDAKILSLYEGTNGIQAMDLLMRKLLMNENLYNFSVYEKFLHNTIDQAKGTVEEKYVTIVEQAWSRMKEVIAYLQELMVQQKFYQLFSDAVFLCNSFSLLTYAWMHLWALIIAVPKRKELLAGVDRQNLEHFLSENAEAAFYQGRVLSGQFYLSTEFNHFFAETDSILKGDTSVVKASDSVFTGALKE